MTSVDTSPDWRWFGTQTPELLSELSVNKFEKGIDWFQNAYAWLWNRLPSETQTKLHAPASKTPVGPPASFVPVLGVAGQQGILGFLSIDAAPRYGCPNEKGDRDEHLKNACQAAEVVFDLFRTLDHDLGDPDPELRLREGGGTSLSLPAIFSALARILGIQWSDDIISTGCLNKGQLCPVEDATLAPKFEAAKRFGYKRMVLVQGQEVPDQHDMEILFVNPDPLRACLEIYSLIPKGSVACQRFAYMLAVFAKRFNRLTPIEDIESITAPFVKSQNPLLQHLAYDIRSRAALHSGMTAKADEYRASLKPISWLDYPTGWLGHYLRYDQVASHSVVTIDLGLWKCDEPIHQAVDRRLNHLKPLIEEEIADKDDLFAILALANTRALRLRFQSRFEQNADRMEQAWQDLTLLQQYWKPLFEYAGTFDKDSTVARQRNQVIGALFDYRTITGQMAPWPGVTEFLNSDCAQVDLSAKVDSHDLACFIEKAIATDQAPQTQEINTLLDKADSEFPNRNWYPYFLPYEQLLRSPFGNKEQRQHAVNQLKQAAHLGSSQGDRSILTLLALRTRKILIENGALSESDFPGLLPHPDTPLRSLAESLINSPETLIARCLY